MLRHDLSYGQHLNIIINTNKEANTSKQIALVQRILIFYKDCDGSVNG